MIEFDKPLVALADCPVLPSEDQACIVFNPFPVISCQDNIYLAHEICHRLAGQDSYAMFYTAVLARKNPLFKLVLNLLLDWYDEYIHGHHSMYLWQKLTDLHQKNPKIKSDCPDFDVILEWYDNRNVDPISKGIRDVIDLIRMADELVPKIEPFADKILLIFGDINISIRDSGIGTRGAGGDVGGNPQSSKYYFQAIAKYDPIIQAVSSIWKNNKYAWKQNYFGEIDWKNLPHLFAGEKMRLPVFRLYQKIALARNIYLVIDRSGSTEDKKQVIMDSAIIIAESLRRKNTPISVIDIGVSNMIINKIDEPMKLDWFTPMSKGGTPLGEVCSQIKGANSDSYLLIITDGQPDNWEKLVSALHKFPGSHLTFVIGDSYGQYVERIKNAISVQPHTIVRELYNASALR